MLLASCSESRWLVSAVSMARHRQMATAAALVVLVAALACRHAEASAVATSGGAAATKAAGGAEVRGKVFGPSLASTVVILYQADGHKRVAHLLSDSSFSFSDVPSGSHLLHAFHVNAYFPEVQIDVGKSGIYRATFLAQTGQGITATQPAVLPLSLRYLGEMTYFEKRKPVDVWSFVKSPYGLMIVFSLVMIFVMPKLKMDPEEFKQYQAELKGGSSSASGGGGGGSGQRAISNR